MANIEKKKYEELSENAKVMVRIIDAAIDNGPLPIEIYDFNPNENEVMEAVKYIIDKGWTGNDNLFVRKVEYTNEYNERETGLYFSGYEGDFDYIEKLGYYTIVKDFPMIMGITKILENKNSNDHYLDGDVYIKLEDGSFITKEKWDELQNKKTK